jgi:hypothetical protein
VKNARILHERMPTREQFNCWFATLEKQLKWQQLKPSQIHNMDESGVDGRKVNMRVIGLPGHRGSSPSIILSAFREHLTMVVTCCADGSHHPVMWLTKGLRQPTTFMKNIMLNGSTPNAVLRATRKYSDIFIKIYHSIE